MAMSTGTSRAHARILHRWIACSILGAVLACSDPEPLCDLCTTSAIIYGRVVDAGGNPVVGNGVSIEVHPERCDSAVIVAASDAGLVTGADGSYRTRVSAFAAPFTGCPRVIVELSGDAQAQITVDGPVVEFLDDVGPNQRRDSVRVDVEVP